MTLSEYLPYPLAFLLMSIAMVAAMHRGVTGWGLPYSSIPSQTTAHITAALLLAIPQVTVAHQAALPEQRIWRSTLASIVADTEGETLSPCIVIIGRVAGLHFGAEETPGM